MSASLNIHNVRSVRTKRRAHWQHTDQAFHTTDIIIQTTEGTFIVQLFSDSPITIDNPEIEVCE